MSHIFAPNKIKINKWKVREGFQVSNGNIILLYELLDNPKLGLLRLKSTKCGFVGRRFKKEGEICEEGQPLLELTECSHTTVIKDLCAECGADLQQNEDKNINQASVPMIHSVPDLKVTEKLAQQLGKADSERLLKDKKLVLLVDLDQTLIHTTNDNVPNNLKDVYHFQLYGPNSPWYHTRLRPGALSFLGKMHKYFELHICTFGARNYAHTIAQFLDEDGRYFSQRILSRDECFNATSKTDNLKALFPCGDSMVCIIDDREDVWNCVTNLIQVKPYHFFQHTGDINAPPTLAKHELDGKGIDFLKDISSISHIEKVELVNEEVAAESSGEENTVKIPEESKSKEDVVEDVKLAEKIVAKTDDVGELKETSIVQENLTVVEESTVSEESKKDEVTQADKKDDTVESVQENSDKAALVEEITVSDESKKEEVTLCDQTVEPPLQNGVDTDETKPTNIEIETDMQVDAVEQTAVASTSSESDKIINVVDDNVTDTESIDNQSTGNRSSSTVTAVKPKTTDDLIVIEDPDDYLLYLEQILIQIHHRFYDIVDKTEQIPDLKSLIPKVKSEILVGKNLVFSGLVPNNLKLVQSKPYMVAKSLGANVTQELEKTTTHLIAATAGTIKVINARKRKDIMVVTPDWLWACAERWEPCDERLFPLLANKSNNKMRQPPLHCQSPEHSVNYPDTSKADAAAADKLKFIDTINPLLSFSNDDLDDMNKDFDQFFESDGSSSSSDEPLDMENPPMEKALKKRKRAVEKEERQEFFTRADSDAGGSKPSSPSREVNQAKPGQQEKEDESSPSEDEMPSAKFRRGEVPSDLDSNSNGSEEPIDDVDDGDWNMMGAALEREFLGLED